MLIAGIDEAGRGPVIGPMVIVGIAVQNTKLKLLEELGVKDSKQLNFKERENIYNSILKISDKYLIKIISPQKIDEYVFGNKLNILEFEIMADIINGLQPDIVRRISPYIKPFQSNYITKVLDASYTPDMNEFINDYLQYNPTRNRVLDLLPLLAGIDEKKVLRTLKDEKISARPTYHYRLPNSKVDEKEWHTYDAWNSWAIIEKLAQDKKKLAQFTQEYMEYSTGPFSFFKKERYLQKAQQWMKKQM